MFWACNFFSLSHNQTHLSALMVHFLKGEKYKPSHLLTSLLYAPGPWLDSCISLPCVLFGWPSRTHYLSYHHTASSKLTFLGEKVTHGLRKSHYSPTMEAQRKLHSHFCSVLFIWAIRLHLHPLCRQKHVVLLNLSWWRSLGAGIIIRLGRAEELCCWSEHRALVWMHMITSPAPHT